MVAIAGSKGRLMWESDLASCTFSGAAIPRVALAQQLLEKKADWPDAVHFFQQNAKLREISIEVNMLCNLSCRYCYLAERIRTEPVPLDVWNARLEEAVGMDVQLVAVVGKEPFIDRRGPAVLRHLDGLRHSSGKSSFRFGAVSNGTLVSRHIDELTAISEISYLDVSLDGLREVNDRVRGKGSFDRAIQGLKSLQQLTNLSSLFVTSVLHRQNLGHIDDFVGNLYREGMRGFHFAPVHNYTLDPSLLPLLLSKADLLRAVNSLGEAAEKYLVDSESQILLSLPSEYVWLFLGMGFIEIQDIREDKHGILFTQPFRGLNFFLGLNLFAPYFWYSARVSHDGYFLAELDSVAWANSDRAIGNIRDLSLAELFSLARKKDEWFERYFEWHIPRLVRVAEQHSLKNYGNPSTASWRGVAYLPAATVHPGLEQF